MGLRPKGIVPLPVTPFTAGPEIDEDALPAEIRYLLISEIGVDEVRGRVPVTADGRARLGEAPVEAGIRTSF